jgi:hypothetical protein
VQLSTIKQIIVEDFPSDSREVVEKLASSLNPFFDQIGQILNKNVSIDNLSQEIKTFTVEVDATGKPKTTTSIKYSLKSTPQGIVCIRAIAAQSGIYPTSSPFISFDIDSTTNTLTIKNITGLPANTKFSLSINIL